VCPMCAPRLQPRRVCCCTMHVNHARLTLNQMDAMPSQREGQLDDDADYQSAYQSVRSTPHMQAHLRPLPALKAGKSRHPTVDGMEEVRVGSFDLVGALPRPGVIWNCRAGL
jgi:hypothetical protein